MLSFKQGGIKNYFLYGLTGDWNYVSQLNGDNSSYFKVKMATLVEGDPKAPFQ